MLWNESFSVGVPVIDAQHQALFGAIERIYSILDDHDAARDRRMVEDAVFYLEQHSRRHFATEEGYMRSINDSSLPLHKAQHDALLVELAQKKQEMVQSDYSPRSVRALLGALLSWLTYHTIEVDRLIGRDTVSQPQPPSSRAVEVLAQSISQVLTDMLQITPTLIDPDHSGALFGNELLCLVSGAVADKQQLSLLFAVDRQVIQHAVGKLFGTDEPQPEVVVLSAFDELCRVLSLHFVKSFYGGAFFKISASSFLSPDQLSAALPADQPLCGALFNDPYGPFSIRIWAK